MPKNTRTFTDLDLAFIANPVTGDISLKYDDIAIKQAVKNLILTINYERPFHPEIGSQVSNLLFDLFSPLTKATLETAITNTILNFEPRVKLRRVEVVLVNDENSADVTVEFIILNTQQPQQVNLTLRRTR